MLEEPILENSNSSMARRPTGTVSPPSNNAAVAGPSHLFTSGIHPSATVALDLRMRITSPEIQILGEVRPPHPQPELLQPVAGPSGIPELVYQYNLAVPRHHHHRQGPQREPGMTQVLVMTVQIQILSGRKVRGEKTFHTISGPTTCRGCTTVRMRVQIQNGLLASNKKNQKQLLGEKNNLRSGL